MAFSESLKFKIKTKSHQTCCICRAVGIEIHHIIPQSEKGKDIEENAAPLCPNCHETYGANPAKRKFIKESREIWFETCKDKYGNNIGINLKELSEGIKAQDKKIEILKKLLQQGFSKIVNDKKKKSSLTIGEIMDYLLTYKKPKDRKGLRSFKLTYTLIFESIGKGKINMEFNKIRDEFLNLFGKLICECLVSYLTKKKKLDWHQGITEPILQETLSQAFFIMLVLIHHKDLNSPDFLVDIEINQNGEFSCCLFK